MMNLKQIITAVVIWRLCLFLVSLVAGYFLIYQPSFPYANSLLLSRNLPQWLVSWANFDGVHYLTIVENGYIGTGLIQAFFPLFPLLIKIGTILLFDPLLFGLIISNLALLGFIVVFYKYLQESFSDVIANWSIIALLLFPTSFFLGALYTESMFLLFVICSLWAGQQKKWWLAALCAALASATRLVGIFLIPALLLELVQQSLVKNESVKQLTNPSFYLQLVRTNAKQVLIISLGITGLVSYMFYLQMYFNDPLYFFHVQSEFGGGRQESLVLLPQVIWRYIKIFISYRPFDLKYFAFVQEFVLTGITYLAIFFAAKKVRWSWTLFALLAITLPTLTGTFSSMPRYVLVALPMFVLFGSYLSGKNVVWKVLLAVSTLLLVCNTILFIQGYWVA